MFIHRRLEGHLFILKYNTAQGGGGESSGVNELYLSSSKDYTRRHNCFQLQRPPEPRLETSYRKLLIHF